VRDIMSTGVLTLSPDLTLRDAIELLTARHISGAPVVAGGRVVGVISANDVLAFEAATPGIPTEQPDQPEQDGLEEPEEQIWERKTEPPGAYFSEFWSDAGAEVAERFAELKGPEWDVLEEHTVAEAMSRGVRSVRRDLSVDERAGDPVGPRGARSRWAPPAVVVCEARHRADAIATAGADAHAEPKY